MLRRRQQQAGEGGGAPAVAVAAADAAAAAAVGGGAQSSKQAASAQAAGCPAVEQALLSLHGSAKDEARHQTVGLLLFGGLLFVAGWQPGLLPAVFLAFFFVAMPWRAVDFVRQRWAFFLLDMCYFVCAGVAWFLLFAPDDPRAEALAYALADGPVAGALVAWQCAWVPSSPEHTVSALMHLLPGVAVFAHRHHTPAGLRGWRGLAAAARSLLARGELPPASLGAVPPPAREGAAWVVAAPLACYLAWQALYFVVVQLLCRRLILAKGLETSYTYLARRAARADNVWNRLVRRGPVWRRLAMYGALQLAYTCVSIAAFLPTYYCPYPVALAYQLVKVALPVWYGAKYQTSRAPRRAFLRGLDALEAYHQAAAAAAALNGGSGGASGAPSAAGGSSDDDDDGGGGGGGDGNDGGAGGGGRRPQTPPQALGGAGDVGGGSGAAAAAARANKATCAAQIVRCPCEALQQPRVVAT